VNPLESGAIKCDSHVTKSLSPGLVNPLSLSRQPLCERLAFLLPACTLRPSCELPLLLPCSYPRDHYRVCSVLLSYPWALDVFLSLHGSRVYPFGRCSC
jgi:hypothetical protein